MDDLPPRLRAVCDLSMAEMREYCGRHEYDGRIQDLSQAGVCDGLARLATAKAGGPPLDDPHDEAQLATFEEYARVSLGDLELHRRNPLRHLAMLDLACYDRDYAPEADRSRARLAHLSGWPQAADAAIDALEQARAAALAAHARLVAHVDNAAVRGDSDAALGSAALTALMSSAEGMRVDLGRLSERADAERDRL